MFLESLIEIDAEYPLQDPRVPDALKLKAVELYAGAGGMSLGMGRAGIDVVRAYEYEQCAVDVYNRNVGQHCLQADLGNISSVMPEIFALKPDIILGGPPCQDFSPAGARVEGERANHTRFFAIYVAAVGPEWFLMENVQRARNSAAWKDAREILKRAGYGLTETVVDFSFYDVPQARKRLVVIGRRGERDDFMQSSIRQAASKSPMSLREMFGGSLGEHVYSHPRAPDRRGVWSVDEPAPTIRNARRPQPPGYRPHPGDSNYEALQGLYFRPFHTGRGVYALDEPAPSIVRTSREKPRPRYLANPHPKDCVPAATARVLTQQDTARIQGLPDEWDWADAKSRDRDQMIANAVPPPAAEILGREIVRRHRGETFAEVPGNFGQWLRRAKSMPPQMVANVKWRVKRAKLLLRGRDLQCRGAENELLSAAFKREKLGDRARSEIKTALKLFRDWQELPSRGQRSSK